VPHHLTLRVRVAPRGRTAFLLLTATALLLTGCSGSPSTGDTTSAAPTSTGEFAPIDASLVAAPVVVPAGYLAGKRPPIPTILSPYLESLADGDPALTALAASLSVTERRALGALGADFDRAASEAAGPSGASSSSGSSGSALTAGLLPSVGGGGRGTSVRAEDSTAGNFASLGIVTGGLSELFGGLVPPGMDVDAGRSPKATIKDDSGATVSGAMELGVKADGEATMGMDFTVTFGPPADGSAPKATGSAAVAFKAKANPCPAADGTVRVEFSAKLGADVKAGSKSAIGTTEVSGTAVAQVDDTATVTAYDIDSRQQNSGTNAAGKATFVDSSASSTFSNMGGSGTPTVAERRPPTLNRESQAVDFAERNRLHEDGQSKAVGFVQGYLAMLQVFWKDGKCVKVVAASPGKVDPGTVSPIAVSVIHKQDGSALAVPVDATLSGPESIDVTRIEKAPGTVTHTASQEPKSKASIEFVSTSRRGIGRVTATITVGRASYIATGGGPGMVVTGTVEDLAAAFTLQGQGTGFTVSFNYTPSGPEGRSGSVRYSGSGGDVTLKGTGTYTVAGAEGGPLTMTVQTNGCATPGGCRANTETITLTPVDS